MTRKRFMRLLMGTGIQRNMAWNLVKETRARGLSYADGFKSAYMTAVVYMCGWRTKKVTKAVREFGKAMAAAALSMEQLGAACRDCVSAESSADDGFQEWKRAQFADENQAVDDDTLRAIYNAMDDKDK